MLTVEPQVDAELELAVVAKHEKLSINGQCMRKRTGRPLREPVVWHGPFVMNTQQQIMECFSDYQKGKLISKKATYRKL